MDILTDIFQSAGLRSRVMNQQSYAKSVALEFPCSKSIGFHALTHGSAYIHFNNKSKPLLLQKGDIALMARGFSHVVSTEESLKNVAVQSLVTQLPHSPSIDKSKMTLVSGAYQFWNDPIHPLFKEFDDSYVIKFDSLQNFDRLQLTINLLAQELAEPEVGSTRVVQNILDVIFSLIMRKILNEKKNDQTSWVYALNDEHIRRALELIHSNCSKEWTLDDLARQVGLSRAGFAQKFKKEVGDTPLHYLTGIRVQKAMELLSNTSNTLEAIADSVGYKDAFSFSKVFKKFTGLPPRDFRKRTLEEAAMGGKFQ